MSEKKHPIDLENLFFTKCIVESIPGHVVPDEKISASPSNHIEVQREDEKSKRWTAMMRTVLNPERDAAWPYHIEVECVAFLTADVSLDEATARRGITITAHSVLFGAIRETVLWLTGRQAYGGLMLGLSVLASAPSNTRNDAPQLPE